MILIVLAWFDLDLETLFILLVLLLEEGKKKMIKKNFIFIISISLFVFYCIFI